MVHHVGGGGGYTMQTFEMAITGLLSNINDKVSTAETTGMP